MLPEQTWIGTERCPEYQHIDHGNSENSRGVDRTNLRPSILHFGGAPGWTLSQRIHLRQFHSRRSHPLKRSPCLTGCANVGGAWGGSGGGDRVEAAVLISDAEKEETIIHTQPLLLNKL